MIRWLLRISIASVFLYAAGAATLHPENWIGFLPAWMSRFAPANLLLPGFSLFEVVLSVWVLSGWKGMYAAVLAAATLFGIIVMNPSLLDITFRDIAIFLAALALAVEEKDK